MNRTFCALAFIILLTAAPVMAGAAQPPLTLDEHLSAIKDHKGSIKNSDSINEKLFQPVMSSGVQFSTFNGDQQFSANLVCASDAPVVRVTAFPVGNLAGIGELNIKVEYDMDLDGQMEGQLTINNVGGMCGNGLIKNCSPSGSWRNCQYCIWTMENGKIREKCDYGTATQAAPIGPQGMKGCFCFNASCGSPALSMLENILSFAATGVLNVLREYNNLLVITKADYQPESLQMSYLGAKVSNCEDAGNDATVAGLTGLMGKFEFPAADALAQAEADPNHPYNSATAQFGQDNATFSRCTMQARVGVENRSVERTALLNFGIGVDADGGSKQCYWFRNGYCGTVYGETRYLDVCISRIVPAALSDLCNQFLANAGIFDKITGISNYRATSGVGNFIGCYGSENDRADQYWEVQCSGIRREDVFICKSPSMSIPGKMIKNEPYNQGLYQGCDEVFEPENSCQKLEERRIAGECSLFTEVVDGIYTIREGSRTGLTTTTICRNVAGGSKSLTVCEPWWKRDRIYRCTGQDPDFSKIKERAQHIGSTIDYDDNSGKWKNQGDLSWNSDGTGVKNVFDPNLAFMPRGEECIPACRVEAPAKITDIYIPGQGKLAADGNYHMPYEGQLSYTLNRDTVQQSVRECELTAGKYQCPVLPGETVIAGCECFDEGAFGQVVSSLAAINAASQNLICSTGNEVGVCTVEDVGGKEDAVICGDFSVAPDGTITGSEDNMKECQPKLWAGKKASNQVHEVTVTPQFRCNVVARGLPEDDHFDNDLGGLIPQPAWFDQISETAISYIKTGLKHDSALIPAPEHGCLCTEGADCSWEDVSDESTLKRNDSLTLDPAKIEPFGAVYFSMVQTGYWKGTHKGESFQCGTHTRNQRFRLAIRKTQNNFVAALDQEKPALRHLQSWPFTQSDLFARQCVQRYTEAYAEFTDPATNAKFKATYLDLLAYQLAAERGELPRETQSWGLPYYPPTYRPVYSFGGIEQSVLPNVPMFWDASISALYEAGSVMGKAIVSISNLKPYVYYYQCPLSAPVASSTNSCGGKAPFGGVDETINGLYCYKHRCDASAVLEPNKPLTGCGMVNDGEWQ